MGFPGLQGSPLPVLVWFGVPLTVGGIVTAPVVVPWLLGAQFQEAVHAFQWVAPYRDYGAGSGRCSREQFFTPWAVIELILFPRWPALSLP